ncbi:MAG TPA: PilZ domain-containing protein [Desulfonauticus sp.]|jgi:c-di-GMP-binding flagellar brake protein YcgR|nr:MAG: Type IV pilus assembly PilZ [Desulfonauticus sp. 38_4375]MDK2922236.1 hypothetical protein [Desulfonauticus sp.]HCO11965.1 PilZ domain-containing protein [Desulfonauticus sp.]
MDEFLDDFEIKYESKTPRKAYRVALDNLQVQLGTKLFKARDISAAGISFYYSPAEESFQKGDILEIEIIYNEKKLLKLNATVVRIRDEYIACAFEDISLREERLLDKLILEAQKEEIELKKLAEKESSEDHEKA